MLDGMRRRWRELKSSPPGRRFQERYDRTHDEQEGGLRRALVLGGGVLLVLAGLFFLPAPGPGMVILALGAAMVARESRRAARALDALELAGRRVAGWALGVWRRAGGAGRAAIVLAGVAVAAGAAWAAWRVLFA